MFFFFRFGNNYDYNKKNVLLTPYVTKALILLPIFTISTPIHDIINLKKLTLKELLEVLGIEVEGVEIDLDDINLDNIDQIIALIKKLLGLDLNYLTL